MYAGSTLSKAKSRPGDAATASFAARLPRQRACDAAQWRWTNGEREELAASDSRIGVSDLSVMSLVLICALSIPSCNVQ